MSGKNTTGLSTAIAGLLGNGKHSDLTISCDGRTWKVHKVIVCTQSSVLAKSVENGWEESVKGEIEHKEYDANTVDQMIKYFYTGNYYCAIDLSGPDTASSEAISERQAEEKKMSMTSPTQELVAHIKVAALAEYYDVPPLKALAFTKYEDVYSKKVNTNGFISVIEALNEYDQDGTFRNHTIENIRKHLNSLMRCPEIFVALQSNPCCQPFIVGVLAVLAKDNIGPLLTSAKTNEELFTQQQNEYRIMQRHLVRILNARGILCTRCASKSNSTADLPCDRFFLDHTGYICCRLCDNTVQVG